MLKLVEEEEVDTGLSLESKINEEKEVEVVEITVVMNVMVVVEITLYLASIRGET